MAGRVQKATAQNRVASNNAIQGANFSDINTTRVGGEDDPFGGSSACAIFETAVNAGHDVYNSGSILSLPQNSWCTFSAFFRAGTRNFAGFFVDGSSSFQIVAFWNLSTFANTRFSTTLTDAESCFLHTPTVFDDGWRRYAVSWYYRGSATLSLYLRLSLSSDGATQTYLGDPAMYVDAYAPQAAFANWPGDVLVGSTSTATMPNLAIGRVAP